MMDVNNGGKLPVSRYKYLLTVARRKGIKDIHAHILVADDGNIAVLPGCEISGGTDGRGMEKEIKNAVEKQGLDFSCVRKYIGSVGSKCFYFEVLVKNKECRNIRWMRKSDIGRLDIPEEEKRVLKAYFDRR